MISVNDWKWLKHIKAGLLVMCVGALVFGQNAKAEGSKDLNEDGTGYRAYTERYGTATAGDKRRTEIYVYAKAGETLYFGSSVKGAKLDYTKEDLGNVTDDQLAKVNKTDILLVEPGDTGDGNPYVNGIMNPKVHMYDIDDDANQGDKSVSGYISTRDMEVSGPQQVGLTNGYKGFQFHVTTTGIYHFKFYSKGLTTNNPNMLKADSDDAFTPNAQNGGTVAAWDVTVKKEDNSVASGRVFTKELFINMGNNKSGQDVLKSTMYAVTDDGYQYSINFNGMDPYGFVFFANNRGLLHKEDDGTYRSLYHSVRSNNNQLSDLSDHNIILNNKVTEDGVDKTYHLFFNKPDSDVLEGLGIPTTVSNPNGSVTNATFTGSEGEGKTYEGKGGSFSFDVDMSSVNATSYEITMTFGEGNTRTLSNTLSKNGHNSIKWDGLDGKGKVVSAGIYDQKISLKLKGGEIHFPFMDVEDNRNGIIITRLNGEDTGKNEVHYNSSANAAGDQTAPWSLSNWVVASKQDQTAGMDSSAGAMQYTGRAGDQTALDIWANYSTDTEARFHLEIDAYTSCTVTKKWDDNGVDRPTSIEVQLMKHGAKVEGKKETLNEENEWTYTWTDLEPGEAYTAIETSIPAGYTVNYQNSGNTATGYNTNITNTYIPKTKDIKVVKNWVTGADTNPPTSLEVKLVDTATTDKDANRTQTLNDANNWTYTWTNLKEDHFYNVTEVTPEDYTLTDYTASQDPETKLVTITLTNTYTPENTTTSFTVKKEWKDTPDDQIPDSLEVTLYENGTAQDPKATLTKEGNWTHTWNDLAVDNQYSVEEICPAGFVEQAGTPTYTAENGWSQTITNTYVSPTTSFTVQKNWNIEEDDTVTVPDKIQAQLYDGDQAYGEPVDVTRVNRWIYTWSNLPTGHNWSVKEVTDLSSQGFTSKIELEVPPEGQSRDEAGWVSDINNTYVKPTSPGPSDPGKDNPGGGNPGGNTPGNGTTHGKTPNGSETKTKSAKTGDSSPLLLGIFLVTVSGLVIIYRTRKKRQ